MGRRTPFALRMSLAFGVLAGIAAVALLQFQRFGELAPDDPHNRERWFLGALTGTVFGAFCWILAKPRMRVTRGMLVVVGINWAAWAMFLLATPVVEQAQFDAINQARAPRDTDGGLDVVDHQPIIMANRFFAPETGVTAYVLLFMAGLPALVAAEYVVPPQYIGTPANLPTRGESQVIAVFAFVTSGVLDEYQRSNRIASSKTSRERDDYC